jgi:outer membrane protein assembly factor BamE (lipoprotein component of BamABCDE complex)
VLAGLAAPLGGCGATIDHHGHVFSDVDMELVRPGMTKSDVEATIGSPDTTGTVGGDTYYYISSTQKTYAFFKPWEINRQILAVYFDPRGKVDHIGHYGLKDGIIVDYSHNQTPARGADMSILAELFGNMSQRGMFKKQNENDATPTPGGL